MRRRDLISLIGGAAVMQVFSSRAQQSGQTRRIGVLTYWGSNNRVALAGIVAFKKALQTARLSPLAA
jgi:hypothetical protein